MKKILVLAATVVILGAGCAPQTSTTTSGDSGITVQTDSGANITIEAAPARVAPKAPVGKPTSVSVPNLGGISPENSEDRVVVFDGDKFIPQIVAVHVGRKVTWRNTSKQSVWPISSGTYTEFDPKAAIGPGQEWSFTFSKAGSWPYRNKFNTGASGVVDVTPVGK